MNEEINKIIANLEGCIGIFDYLLTPKENQLLVLYIKDLQQENQQLQERINKALNKIDNMFDRGDTNTIIDDLLELDKILKGSDSNE